MTTIRKRNRDRNSQYKSCRVSKDIVLKLQPVPAVFEQPKEKSIIITNPPYGERISRMICSVSLPDDRSERVWKHAFVGNEAWVLSSGRAFRTDLASASQKVPLFNGPLECEFRKYEI